MTTTKTVLYTNSRFDYASPRYHSSLGFNGGIAADDFLAYDGINGTCDKYFPCYSLTSSPKAKTLFIDANGVSTEVKGSLEFRVDEAVKNVQVLGRKDTLPALSNSNLGRYEVDKKSQMTTNLNPGWCDIQIQTKTGTSTNDPDTYLPQFLIRVLGDNETTKYLYANKLEESKIGVSSSDFLKGEIVEYKNNLFRCVKVTKRYPPSKQESTEYWQYLNLDRHVFHADMFVLNKNKAVFFKDVQDDKRIFNPIKNEDDTLIAWNVSYYD